MRRNMMPGMRKLAAAVYEPSCRRSACALSLKDYGRALAGDPAYAEPAARISALACDRSELLPADQRIAQGAHPAEQTRYARLSSSVHLATRAKIRASWEEELRALGFRQSLSPATRVTCVAARRGTYFRPAAAARGSVART